MAALTAQVVGGGSAGAILPTYAALSAGGDSFQAGGSVFLHLKNASATTACVVTVATPGTVEEGIPIADPTVTVPLTSERIWGPFPSRLFGDSGGNVQLTYSFVTTCTIAVLNFATA